MRLIAFVLVVSASAVAQADTYWDVPKAEAEAIASSLATGDVVIRYCGNCGGHFRVLLVEAATVGAGTYSKGHTVVLKGKMLFAGVSAGEFGLREVECGVEGDGADPPMRPEQVPTLEYIDIPYSYHYTSAAGPAPWVFAVAQPDRAEEQMLLINEADRQKIDACIASSGGATSERVPTMPAKAPVIAPAKVEPSPRGCGCQSGGPGGPILVLLALAFIGWFRR